MVIYKCVYAKDESSEYFENIWDAKRALWDEYYVRYGRREDSAFIEAAKVELEDQWKISSVGVIEEYDLIKKESKKV